MERRLHPIDLDAVGCDHELELVRIWSLTIAPSTSRTPSVTLRHSSRRTASDRSSATRRVASGSSYTTRAPSSCSETVAIAPDDLGATSAGCDWGEAAGVAGTSRGAHAKAEHTAATHPRQLFTRRDDTTLETTRQRHRVADAAWSNAATS